jgi:hypothetical protein
MKKKLQKRKSPKKIRHCSPSKYFDGMNLKKVAAVAGSVALLSSSGSIYPRSSDESLTSNVLVSETPYSPLVETISNILGIDSSTVKIDYSLSSMFPVVRVNTTDLKSLLKIDDKNSEESSHPSLNNPNLYLKVFKKKVEDDWISNNRFNMEQMIQYLKNMKELHDISNHVYQYEPYVIDTNKEYVLISQKINGITLLDYLDKIYETYNSIYVVNKTDLELEKLKKKVESVLNQLHDVSQYLLDHANFVHDDAHFRNILINENTFFITYIDIEPNTFTRSETETTETRVNRFNSRVRQCLYIDTSEKLEHNLNVLGLWNNIVYKPSELCIIS